MKYDLIIIGGGPAGIISAITAKKYYPNKNILLIKDIEKGVIPCGIPYMFTTLNKPEDNCMGNEPLEKNNIEIKIDKVIEINKTKKQILTKSGLLFEYGKLILATGASPIIPKIKGIDKKNIFPIIKELGYLTKLNEQIKKSKNIVIIGGGFIGVEFADELSRIKNNKVFLVELLPQILMNSFDKEFSKKAEDEIKKENIKIYNNIAVKEILGEESVKEVLLSNGEKIPADLVILGIGAKANSELAEKAGLKINEKGIIVNDHLKTSDENIFAIGDCSQKKEFLTNKKTNIMLASTATTQARIVGYDVFANKMIKNKSTLASYSTKINNIVLASTGITQKYANERDIEIFTGYAESMDKHPGKLPSTSKIGVKLIFSKKSKRILGGQIFGGDSIGEMINIISTAIQKNFTVDELEILQIATHPKLTPAPTSYPIINAAQDALQKINKEKNDNSQINQPLKEFLDKKNIFAVVGVSRDEKKYGNKVYHDLKNAGYEVYAINPRIDKIDDIKVYAKLKDLPKKPDVVSIVVPPEVTMKIVKECKELGINKIWMQPGSQSEEAINYCKKNKINLLYDLCIMIEKNKKIK